MIRNVLRCVTAVHGSATTGRPLILERSIRNQAFDAGYDQDELLEARKWHSAFREDNLPTGQTSYSRSSGPGGQHVNK
jgi:peptidyl-tRNA hydrolase ICT1